MANTKISQLTALTNPTGNEELVYAYNNANGKMTLDTMKTYSQAGMQTELVSGTSIKTINGTSILGSGNLVISGGGGGSSTGTVALNSLENITAGALCSFTGAGVKKLRRGFYGTADSGVSLTVPTNQYNVIDSVAVTSDTTVIVYCNNSNNMFVVAIKRDGETRTVGIPIKILDDGRFPKICCPYEGEFVIAYGDYTGSGDVHAVSGSVSGTIITLGTPVQLANVVPNQGGIGITRRADVNTREFVVFYTNNSDSKYYSVICSYNPSLAITGGTPAIFFASTASEGNIGVTYLGGGMAAVIRDAYVSSTYYTYVGYINVASSSISSSNRAELYSGANSTTVGFSPKVHKVSDDMYVADPGESALGIFLIKISGGGSAQTIVDNMHPGLSNPTMGRSYCMWEDGIVGQFANQYINGAYNIIYTKYKCTDAGFVFIDRITYGAANTNDLTTVSRIANGSCCTFFDYANGKLLNVLYQDESNQFVGINEDVATAGNSVDITYSGVVNTTGLTPGSEIYIGLDGAAATSGNKLIGLALSSTQALLK